MARHLRRRFVLMQLFLYFLIVYELADAKSIATVCYCWIAEPITIINTGNTLTANAHNYIQLYYWVAFKGCRHRHRLRFFSHVRLRTKKNEKQIDGTIFHGMFVICVPSYLFMWFVHELSIVRRLCVLPSIRLFHVLETRAVDACSSDRFLFVYFFFT